MDNLATLRNPQTVIQISHRASRLAHRLTLPLILLLATLLRFFQLSGQSLWSDEGNSVALARRSFVEIARRTAFDIHPPFYYWLLKIWISIFGDSEIGLRSLSAILGVSVVYLIYLLGIRLFNRRVGLIAAFIATLSPLQVYYSQETRMYMLLAFLGCLTVLLGLLFIDRPYNIWLNIAYILTVTTGLYTHYAYPIILLAINLAVLFYLIQNSQLTIRNSHLLTWIGLQLIPFLFYLPWLPIAWRQLTTWPSQLITSSLYEVLGTMTTALLFGLSWPFEGTPLPIIVLGVVILAIPWLTYYVFHLSDHVPDTTTCLDHTITSKHLNLSLFLLYLWFLLPVLLTTIIFNPTFLKFLLVAGPPLALLLAWFIRLVALTGNLRRPRSPQYAICHTPLINHLVSGTLLLGFSITSVISLGHYYTYPTYARDNYRSIVNFIKAIGKPGDAIILHAEGQQDVFNYYFERALITSIPIYPLPRQRPLDEAATLSELQTIAHTAEHIYAVYWATHQADPTGLIETWLDTNLYKASDQWYGNVRLVSYASPQTNLRNNLHPLDNQLGEHIGLTGYALSATQLTPGEILQIALEWETDALLSEPYTVFVQVLDSANHLVGQRDAQPLMPTLDWPVGEPVVDAHGVFIEPGTPPGQHRLIVGLYQSETGQRLPVTAGDRGETTDFIKLADVEITRRDTPLPLETFNIQVPLDAPMHEVTLLGYDLYKLGHRSAPETPLRPGDPLNLVVYWLPHQPVQTLTDQLTIQVISNNGEPTPLSFTYPAAGVDYPINEWSPGEIIRGQYDFFLNKLERGTYRLRLSLATVDAAQQPVAVTKPFRIE